MPNPKEKPTLMFGKRWEHERAEIDKLQLNVHKEVQSRKATEHLDLPPENEHSPTPETEEEWSQNLEKLKEIGTASTCFCPSFQGSLKTTGLVKSEITLDNGHLKGTAQIGKSSVKLDVDVKDELKKPKPAWYV